MKTKHTPGPWHAEIDSDGGNIYIYTDAGLRVAAILEDDGYKRAHKANARLIAAAPCQHREMLRYLPILERAEADPEIWNRLTEGLGISTANRYRFAIAKATTEAP